MQFIFGFRSTGCNHPNNELSTRRYIEGLILCNWLDIMFGMGWNKVLFVVAPLILMLVMESLGQMSLGQMDRCSRTQLVKIGLIIQIQFNSLITSYLLILLSSYLLISNNVSKIPFFSTLVSSFPSSSSSFSSCSISFYLLLSKVHF